MKIAVVQSANLGFFPRFFQDLCDASDRHHDDICCFLTNSGRNRRNLLPKQVLWGVRFNWFFHYNLYKWTGIQDIWSFFSTIDLLFKIKKYHPDIINLHVVNEYNLCFPLFIRFLNSSRLPIVWTFHDTRVITARCASFEEDQCMQWKTGCKHCTPRAIYQPSFINSVSFQWSLRKKWYNSIERLHIVTPSKWLSVLVSQSFLHNKSVTVINNGIDTKAFSSSTIVPIFQLDSLNGYIVLSVASVWQPRKGLYSMIELRKRLPNNYHIVIVGDVPEFLRSSLPPGIITIPKTNTKEELISIYRKATVFVNATLADNFPTVNIEALGAGLPVVTFNTGGSAECIDATCGISVEKGDDQALLNAVVEVCENPDNYKRENCIRQSRLFSTHQFDKYIELFHKLSVSGA